MWSARPPAPVLIAEFQWDVELIALAAVLAGLIGAGALAVYRVKRWWNESEGPATVEDQIEHYEALVEEGELDPQEFDRIRARLEHETASRQPHAPSAQPPSDGGAFRPGPPPGEPGTKRDDGAAGTAP
jgi:hypothetical protein